MTDAICDLCRHVHPSSAAPHSIDGLVEHLGMLKGVVATAFMAANAWAAENGHKTLYERTGARPYDPATEGSLKTAMIELTAALLAGTTNTPYGHIVLALREEMKA